MRSVYANTHILQHICLSFFATVRHSSEKWLLSDSRHRCEWCLGFLYFAGIRSNMGCTYILILFWHLCQFWQPIGDVDWVPNMYFLVVKLWQYWCWFAVLPLRLRQHQGLFGLSWPLAEWTIVFSCTLLFFGRLSVEWLDYVQRLLIFLLRFTWFSDFLCFFYDWLECRFCSDWKRSLRLRGLKRIKGRISWRLHLSGLGSTFGSAFELCFGLFQLVKILRLEILAFERFDDSNPKFVFFLLSL